MRLFPATLDDNLPTFAWLPKRLRWGAVGIEDDGAIKSTATMQLLLVQTATHTVTDTYDPLQRPSSVSIVTQLYAAEGKFMADPEYAGKVPGGAIDSPVGIFSVYGEVDGAKRRFTEKTPALLRAVFEQAGGDTEHKSFFFGRTLSDDTVAEMEEVDVIRVVPDFMIGAVQVTVRKRTAR